MITVYPNERTAIGHTHDLDFRRLQAWLTSPPLPETTPSFWSPLVGGEVTCLVLRSHVARSERERAQNRFHSLLGADSFVVPNYGDGRLLVVQLQRPVLRSFFRDFSKQIADWLDVAGLQPFEADRRFHSPRVMATAMARRAA